MTGPNSEPTRKWVYRDGLHIAAEMDASDNITSRFVYSAGRMPVQMIRGNTVYLLVTDYLGSLRAVVRLSDGEIMQSMEYDEFGRVITDDVVGGFERVPFGYAGGLYDRDTGLVRFGAREYDAETGRWVSKDPVGLGAGSNVYAYCEDDPVDCLDPTGNKGTFTLYAQNELYYSSVFPAYTEDFGPPAPAWETTIPRDWGHVWFSFQPEGGNAEYYGLYPAATGIDIFMVLDPMYGGEGEIRRTDNFIDPNLITGSYSEGFSDSEEARLRAYIAAHSKRTRYNVWSHTCVDFALNAYEVATQRLWPFPGWDTQSPASVARGLGSH